MNKKIYMGILLFALFIFASCETAGKKGDPLRNNPPIPGKELTRVHNGKAVISDIVRSKENPGNDDSSYVEIYFHFIPDNPDAPEDYLCGECPDRQIKLFYDNRESFHTTWVKKWDIKPGKEYHAIRHELLRKDDRASVSHEVFLEPEK